MLSCYVPYLKYVLRHKWYVFQECRKQGIFVQGLLHDLTKFLPDEMKAYANFFYGKSASDEFEKNGNCKPAETGDKEFDLAWLKHLHRNPHHWQYWILRKDDGTVSAFPMPKKYAIEMVCDWIGAGKAQNHGNDLKEWYENNKHKLVLHDDTRKFIEELVGKLAIE